MKNIARIALLIVATSTAAWANSITLDQATTHEALSLGKLTQTAKSGFAPAEFAPSAMARSFDYEKDGYIGTVHDGGVFSLDRGTPSPETAVPEPASVVLLGSGLALAAIRRRRTADNRT